MLICCPECQTCYEVDDRLIPPEGLNLRCAKCRHVWHTDASTEDTAEPLHSQHAFDTDEEYIPHIAVPTFAPATTPHKVHLHPVFHDDDLPPAPQKKCCSYPVICNIFWWLTILLLFLATIIVGSYVFREKITNIFPQSDVLYQQLDKIYLSSDKRLQVKSSTWNYFTSNGEHKISISGYIYNPSKDTLTIPPLKFELLNQQGNLIQIDKFEPDSNQTIAPYTNSRFKTTITVPALLVKYIYISFFQ